MEYAITLHSDNNNLCPYKPPALRLNIIKSSYSLYPILIVLRNNDS